MPYVGNPLADAFSSREKQDLTGQSGTSFTLTHSVSHANDLSVYINHVRQEPTTAYSVNGTTLTTTGSVAGTDDFYIIYDELAVQSISHPTDQSLTATSGTFTSGLVGTTGTFSGALSGTDLTLSGDMLMNGGELSVKNGGSLSQLRLYCEVNNAHYAALQAPAHSAFSGNVISTLPNYTGTLISANSSGNVGIGTTSESYNSNWTAIDFGDQGGLAHYDGGDTVLSNNLYHDGAWKAKETGLSSRYAIGNGYHIWYTGANASADAAVTLTERMRIHTDGNVGIGRATVSESGYNSLVIGGPSATTGSKMKFYDSDGNFDGQIYAGASGIFLQGSTDARIFGNGIKGMRVESDGQCTISRGDESAGNNHAALTLSYSLGNDWGGFQMYTYSYYDNVNFRLQNNDTNGGRNHSDFLFKRAGSTVGSISLGTGGTSFNTSSDYRMKEDTKSISNAIETVKELKPVNFKWKKTGIRQDGFIAHEVDDILDYVVSGKKDEVKTYENVVLNKDGYMIADDIAKEKFEERIIDKDDEEASPIGETTYPEGSTWKATHEDIVPQSLDASKLVPILTAALQEAIKRIEVLESK